LDCGLGLGGIARDEEAEEPYGRTVVIAHGGSAHCEPTAASWAAAGLTLARTAAAWRGLWEMNVAVSGANGGVTGLIRCIVLCKVVISFSEAQ
jgi:hypothetical protein